MPAIKNFLIAEWPKLVVPCSVLAGVLIAGWIARRFLFHALNRWAARTKLRLGDLVVQTCRRPFMIWVLILGLHLAAESSSLPRRATFLVGRALLILWVISFTFVAASLTRNLIRYYAREARGALPVTSLTENLATLTVFSIAALIILNMLGISLTPILTAFGVGGLAIALALQSTLANLFAGFYVSLAGQVRVGDYIKLDTGEEGYVTDIAWRSTTIRALQNNLIIIPNAKLAQAIVTNFHLPEKRMSLSIPVSVSYESDPDEVERVLIEEAKEAALHVPGLVAEPAPVVRFIPGFGESSLNFTLVCQVAEFGDQFTVQHELRKRIFRRFREAGIVMPFPTRTVYLQGPPAPGRDGGETWLP